MAKHTNVPALPALPVILVTGASGIVGRHFIEAVKDDFFIYAVARRSRDEAEISTHPNIKWLQADIANFSLFKSVVMNALKDNKSRRNVDYVLHLASYYDFNYTRHSEYQRTNIDGTRHVLELAKALQVKRFVFTSSLAAANFPAKGANITEQSPVDAVHPYAASKKAGEELVREYSRYFPCAVVRPAAVFTDWCEYGILYMQLSRWFSRKFSSRVLEGKGEAGVPYLHSEDFNKFLLRIFERSSELPGFDIYIASPDGATSHRDLFETAAKYYFGQKIKPFFFPKPLIMLVVIFRDMVGRLIGRRPFERPWMLKYIDRKLRVDSSRTRQILSWKPSPRFHILRRLLYMVEKMKTHPEEWHYRNTRAMKRIPQRPNLLVYEIMVNLKHDITSEIKRTLQNPEKKNEFSHYQQINPENFNWDIDVFYQLLTASVRNKDRLLLINYAHDLLIPLRFNEGFSAQEVCAAILTTGKIVISRLLQSPDLKGMEELIHDSIFLTLQLTVDEVENGFEKLSKNKVISRIPQRGDIEEKLKELATFCISEDTCR